MRKPEQVNPVVAAVLESAGKDEVLWLQGYIGPTDRNYVRLYDSLRLTLFLDITESDVIAARNNEDESDPWTRLAVRRSGVAQLGSRRSDQTKSFSLRLLQQKKEIDFDACERCVIENLDDLESDVCNCICVPNLPECKGNGDAQSFALFGAYLLWSA
ncbi:MAG: hypothetical protein PVI09_15050 [Anaerolineae bacterium]|jgi:hypothetical protein